MSKKKSFLIYCDTIDDIDHLTDEEIGKLFRHILEYENGNEVELNDRLILTAWKPIKAKLDRDREKYKSVSKRNSDNAKKRWHKKNATACDRIPNVPSDTKNADRDSDIDIDTINNSKWQKQSSQDAQWIETQAMQNKCDKPTIEKYLDLFVSHLITISEQKENLREFKTHFTNWLNKQKIEKVRSKPKKQRFG